MKLAIICPKPPWAKEGQAKVIKEQIPRLKKFYDLEVFCCDPFVNKSRVITWRGVKINLYKSIFPSYLLSYNLLKALKKSDADVFYAHGFTNFMSLAAALTKKDRTLIFQPYYHSLGSTTFFKLFRKIYDPLIGRFLIKSSDLIFCISKYEKDTMDSYFGCEDKSSIVGVGIDLFNIKRAKPYKNKEKFILYVGRIEKYKNIDLVIRALVYLDDYDLCVIGRGGYDKKLRSIIRRLGLNNRVRIVHNVEDSDLYRWYKSVSLVFNLSEVEAFGLTVVEGLAAGKRVLVNNGTSLKELADLFPKHVIRMRVNKASPREIADIVRKIDKSKFSLDLSRFNWDFIIKKYVRLLSKSKK